MARQFSMIGDIKTMKQALRIAVRITRLWYIDNPPYAPGLEMILMDSKGDKIHASIREKNLLSKWKGILKEDDCYEMQNFIVQRADGHYRSTAHAFKLSFSTGTIGKKIECSEIPPNIYHFTSFDDIVSGKASTDVLIEVIAQFTDFTKHYADVERQKAVISLADQSGKILKCTLWEGYASKLVNYINNNKGVPIIIILTLAKIHEATDNYPVSISNSKWSSILLINEDIKEINDYKASLSSIEVYESGSQMLSQVSGSSQLSQFSQFTTMDKFFYKADVMNLADICGLRQDTQCCTVATIDNVLAGYGWSYDHCMKCNKAAPNCGCGDQNTRIETRFRLEVMVSSGGDSTKFVLWDNDCKDLLNISAAELRKQMIAAGEVDSMAIPATVDKLEGKELAFKIKVQPTYRRSSVIKVSDEKYIIEEVLKRLTAEQEASITEKGKSPCSINAGSYDKGKGACSIEKDEYGCQAQSLSATADFDPEQLDTCTPAKRLFDSSQFEEIPTQDLAATQLSSTKLSKHIKME